MHPRHPGLLHMPANQYHADQAIGHSGILKMLKSPAHLRETLDHPQPPTPAMAFGSAVHTYVLEPERFSKEFVVAEKFDRRTKEGKEAAARFEEANQGKTLITPEDLTTLSLMRAAVLAHQGAAKLLAQGEAELSAFWSDSATGIACRCRPDWFNGTTLVDLKSCIDASSRGFSRAIANFGYDVQAAFYVDGIKRVTGMELPFLFVAVEKESPHAVAVYRADPEIIKIGRKKYQAALQLLKWCQESGTWPAYQPAGEVELISLPRWAANAEAFEFDAA
jgi:hypothetical protein